MCEGMRTCMCLCVCVHVCVLLTCRSNNNDNTNKTLPLLYFSLIPSLTADLHPNAGHCSTAITSFASCSPLARLKAIKTCLDIFRMRSLLRCFVKRGETYPMYVFSLCVNSVCTSHRKSCPLFKYEMNLCSSGSKLTGDMRRAIQQPCLKDKGKLE